VAKGAKHVVECGVLNDGTSPALDFLNSLRAGTWSDPKRDTSGPPDEQIKDWAMFMRMAKRLADFDMPTGGKSQTRDLEDGIWEFKRDRLRLSWYDTNGAGSYDPKPWIHDRAQSPAPDDDESWWFPLFDWNIRLGHAFPKGGDFTDTFDIQETIRVRAEDVAHDIE